MSNFVRNSHGDFIGLEEKKSYNIYIYIYIYILLLNIIYNLNLISG
jgi:hypothetical protein